MITKVKSDYLITLSEAKQHLHVDTTDEDNYITSLIKAAVHFAEQYIQKDIATTSNTLIIKDFSGSVVEIDEGNLASITSLVDEDAVSYPVDDYETFDSYFTIDIDPSTISEKDITCVFITGFTTVNLPPTIKTAILIKIADLYDIERTSYVLSNFQSQVANRAYESLLAYYCAIRVKYIRN